MGADSNKRQLLRRLVLFTVAIAFLLTAGIGAAYARQEALKGVQAIEQEVQTAVQVEQWMTHNSPELSADVLIDDGSSPYVNRMARKEQSLLAVSTSEGTVDPVVRIRDTWFADDIAAAKLTFTEPAYGGAAPVEYRQTRFYRETEGGWLRTMPAPDMWGAPLTLETDHLSWQYRRRDQAAVAEVAGEIDALYAALLRDYDLASPAREDKLAISVQPDVLPGIILLYASPAEPIVVTSPSVSLTPAGLTDSYILKQAVALALLKHLWAKAVAQHGIEESWPSMAGVSLWELWETGLSLSEWRDEILHWVFADAASNAGDAAVELPVRYGELCTVYTVWMNTPAAVGIPLSCDDRGDSRPVDDNDLLAGLQEDTSPTLRMPYLRYSTAPYQTPIQLGDSIKTYTVVDYAISAYGRETLPKLVAAFGQHDKWETLIPAVYGVSLNEFEQGWRQHVAGLAQ